MDLKSTENYDMQIIIFSTENCVKTMLHTYSQKEKQTEKQTERQTYRQNCKPTQTEKD